MFVLYIVHIKKHNILGFSHCTNFYFIYLFGGCGRGGVILCKTNTYGCGHPSIISTDCNITVTVSD